VLSVLNVAYALAPVGPDAVGGSEQVLSAVETATARAGHRSLVLACEGSCTTGKLFTVKRAAGPLTQEARARLHRLYRAEIARIVAQERVDVVHFHGLDFFSYLPPEPTPVLATLHLPPSWYPSEIFSMQRPATMLTCVSRSQRSDCPQSQVPIEEVPNGIDLGLFSPSGDRQDYGLVLGRVCPEKGIHLALDAAHRAGTPLLIAGEVFEYPDHLRYFAQEIEPRLDENRRFIGPVGWKQRSALLSRASCLIVPSLVAETSSLVTMEALASGTPVVAFGNGNLAHLIQHGRTGFLVHNRDEMVSAIRVIRNLRADECRPDAERRFGHRGMCSRYLRLYSSLAERGGHLAHSRNPRSALEVHQVTNRQGFEQLEPEWIDLWSRCPDATIFQRPEWLLPWCRHLAQDEISAVALRRGGRLVALAPLFSWQDRTGRVLSLLGAGVSDYLDLLCERTERSQAARALVDWLRSNPLWDRCELSELRAGSVLLELPHSAWRSTVEPQDVCPGLSLRIETPIHKAVTPSMWSSLSSARRRVERRMKVQVEEPTPESLDDLLTRLEQLHQARWQARGEPGIMGDERRRAFYREAAHRFHQRGLLGMYALRFGDEVAAVLCGFRDRSAFRYYLSGFEPTYGRYSPGMLVVGHAIETAWRQGAAVFDFLRGGEPYKYAWGAQDLTRLYRHLLWR
jgi:CelD/BcsL family acetyltransferase involved in cellulose biosynthesis/glycosyltransferase involved in cell wall biosynthesis